MRKILLAPVAALALAGCNSNAATLSCSSNDDILKSIMEKMGYNLLSVDAIVTRGHHEKSVECEASLHFQRRLVEGSFANTFRVGYSVSLTDDSKIWVQIENILLSENQVSEQERLEADRESREAAKKMEEEQAAKEKAANTIDTTSACDGPKSQSYLRIVNYNRRDSTLTNIVTTSTGCLCCLFR